MPFLIVNSPALPAPLRVPFFRAVTVGRAPQVDVQILDGRISKRHATIRFDAERRMILEDLDSRNGTFLNGQQIRSPVEIKDGDVVQMGDSRLVIEGSERAPLPPTPEPGSKLTVATTVVRQDFPPAELVGTADQLKEDYDRLRLMWRLNLEIGFDRPLQESAVRILRVLISEFDADRGVMFVVRGGGAPAGTPVDPDHLDRLAAATRRDADHQLDIDVSRTVLGVVLDQRRGVLAADARADERFDRSKSVIMQGIRSTLCVPMVAPTGTLAGVIAMDSTRVINAFHEKDLVVLETVGTQVAMAIENVRLVEQMRRDAVARERLSRVLSPNLVEEVVSGRLAFTEQGELREVALLFTDVRGFTKLIQRHSPPDVLKMLNEHFTIIVEHLFKHEGTLDKFLGDGLMALFGAPLPQHDACDRAVQVAREVRAALRAWNAGRVEGGEEPLYVGMGIATGPVVVGAMGSEQTLSYTAVGPAVNLAARLCAVAAPEEILVSRSVADRLSDPEHLGDVRLLELKGFEGPMEAFPLVS